MIIYMRSETHLCKEGCMAVTLVVGLSIPAASLASNMEFIPVDFLRWELSRYQGDYVPSNSWSPDRRRSAATRGDLLRQQ